MYTIVQYMHHILGQQKGRPLVCLFVLPLHSAGEQDAGVPVGLGSASAGAFEAGFSPDKGLKRGRKFKYQAAPGNGSLHPAAARALFTRPLMERHP